MYILLFLCNYNDWEQINNNTQDLWTTFIVGSVLLQLESLNFSFFVLQKKESHMGWTTWGWVNNDNISIFG